MIVCFLHAKVGHRQAIYLDPRKMVNKTPAMKIVGVFAFLRMVFIKSIYKAKLYWT